jgi:putative restriction endonuclease
LWRDLIDQIGTWKTVRGKRLVRAVHKPLLTLMMLARAQDGKSNEIRYRDIDEPLTKALREFGPPRRTVHPEYPFWYLQNDGFWVIRDAARFKGGAGGQPTRRALIDGDAVAVVPAELWTELQRNPGLHLDLALEILHAFWPESVHDIIASELGLDLDPLATLPVTRTRDPEFRAAVLRAYERRCAICGFQARLGHAFIGLEAAHIYFRVDGGPNVVNNGLLLCSLHHKAFDLGAIGVARDRRILVSQDLDGNAPARRFLVAYSGRPIQDTQVPADRPGAAFLRWHEKNVFRGPAREPASTGSR